MVTDTQHMEMRDSLTATTSTIQQGGPPYDVTTVIGNSLNLRTRTVMIKPLSYHVRPQKISGQQDQVVVL